MNRIMIAATGSGNGKTTITCGVLKALKIMGKKVVSFKCGPDYVDPMLHKKVLGIQGYNLDTVMVGEEKVKYLLNYFSKDFEFTVVEGVMGIYDGLGLDGIGSSNSISILTETPVILVVNAKGKFNSICAEISGYLNYKENNIKGIFLNNVSKNMYPKYKELIESELDIKVLGYLPLIPEVSIDSRYLGLIIDNNIDNKINILGETLLKTVDFDMIFKLSKVKETSVENRVKKLFNDLNIYISKDDAFCFSYDDNIELIKLLGANIHFFSPLNDKEISEKADGVIFFGGYPELFGKQLSENISFKNSVKDLIKKDVPIYAEGGGFMYLQESIVDINGNIYPMVSGLKGTCTMTNKLQNFGYVTLVSKEDNILCKKGERINAHEFHYSKSSNEGDSFDGIKRRNNRNYPCIIAENNIFAGYPQINFWANMDFIINFLKSCVERKEKV